VAVGFNYLPPWSMAVEIDQHSDVVYTWQKPTAKDGGSSLQYHPAMASGGSYLSITHGRPLPLMHVCYAAIANGSTVDLLGFELESTRKHDAYGKAKQASRVLD
jgi:hypothetical protein